MAFVSEETALDIHRFIDEKVGFFRHEEMSERAQKFHDDQKQKFVDIYTKQIPDQYWFQGTNHPSVEIRFNSSKAFYLCCPSEGVENRRENEFFEKINEEMKVFRDRFELDEDDLIVE